MNTQLIRKSIEINAPKEKVWDVLVQDDLSRKWYAEFRGGTHAETDWKEGSKVLFLDNDSNGMIAHIETNKPGELLVIGLDGYMFNGVEDYESEGARAVKDGHEIYRLAERNGVTTLDIEGDMTEDMLDETNGAWDRAIMKIKQLAETL